MTEAENQQAVARPPNGDEVAADVAVLKKQQTTLHQQIQSLISRVIRLDRDLHAMAVRKGVR